MDAELKAGSGGGFGGGPDNTRPSTVVGSAITHLQLANAKQRVARAPQSNRFDWKHWKGSRGAGRGSHHDEAPHASFAQRDLPNGGADTLSIFQISPAIVTT